MQSHVSFAWPPLKSVIRPLPNRPLPRQRRDLRPEKGFGRYWQRLMRKHRQHILLRKTASRGRMAMRPYTNPNPRSLEPSSRANWYAVSV